VNAIALADVPNFVNGILQKLRIALPNFAAPENPHRRLKCGTAKKLVKFRKMVLKRLDAPAGSFLLLFKGRQYCARGIRQV
jgi:hypothetical protein